MPEVRLVGPNGEQVGIVRIEQAMKLATESELDLVEVAPEARPPVVKLMDFGKFKYESAMKERAARKNQANTVLKEIRYRLKIDDHDYATKTGHVTRFLKGGDKVKVMIMFRGREQSRPEMGLRLLQRVAADVQDLGSVESTPRVDGRNMVMVIGPHKKKAEVKTEAKAAKQAQKDAAATPVDDAPAMPTAPAAPTAEATTTPTPEVPTAGPPTAGPSTVQDTTPAVVAPQVKAPTPSAPAARATKAPTPAAPAGRAPRAPRPAAPTPAAPAAPATGTSDDTTVA